MAIVEVVKYNMGSDVFAWKYPNSELGTWTQVIVNESQEAVLVKNGQICDILQAGRHTLTTNNIPILRGLVNIPFGGKSPFAAEIWFINKAFSLDIKWGTSTPIQIRDPKYSIFIPVRAFGQFGVKVENPKRLLLKLMGTMSLLDADSLVRYFRGFYLTKAKDIISEYFVQKNVSIMEINAYLEEISEYLMESLSPVFQEYGIRLTAFQVNDINVPEDDKARANLKDALSKRAEMDIIGYDYRQKRTFDTLESAAKNESSLHGGIMGSGIGLAMGMEMGSAVGGSMSGFAANMSTGGKRCVRCGKSMGDGRFCPDCGWDSLKSQQNFAAKCIYCRADVPIGAKFCPSCGRETAAVCRYCGAEIPPGGKFCPSCGKQTDKKCPSCGREVSEKDSFCPSCGEEIK